MRNFFLFALNFLFCFVLSCNKDVVEKETQCLDAEKKIGHSVCLHKIKDYSTWESVSLPVDPVDVVRSTKYMIPADDTARLLPVFLDSNYYEMHYDFMITAFPDLFPALTTQKYLDLLFEPNLHEYYVGDVIEYNVVDGGNIFAFYVAGDYSNPDFIKCKDLKLVYDELSNRMLGFNPAVIAADNAQIEFIDDCGIEVFKPGNDIEYELYNSAVGYGMLRRYNLNEFIAAQESGDFGWQDILAMDEAPPDIETVISGVVTGTRQSPLSHLAVRSASRGTPNCYLKDAYGFLEQWDGKLVKFECAPDGLKISETTIDEAQKFWDELRPEKVEIESPDLLFQELVELHDAAVSNEADRLVSLSRFGGKGRNLAWLYQNIDNKYQLKGFLIPMYYYKQFIDNNSWTVDLGSGEKQYSFAQTIDAYLIDETFKSDVKVRREKLDALRVAMRAAACDQDFINMLETKITQVFSSDKIMVRFRSSSNAEDGLYFNGAGLYKSTSACLADERDSDESGPSLCDTDKIDERDLCRAQKKVWASLWKFGAYNEREWYGIDHSFCAMGILVNTRTKNELANIVGFSGNPIVTYDSRYLVSSQIGELDVVSSQPGIWPEQALLKMTDGAVSGIEYILGSSELTEGENVLDESQLNEIGQLLYSVDEIFPLDIDVPDGGEVLMDTEWKVKNDGGLIIKQVRPFLKI